MAGRCESDEKRRDRHSGKMVPRGCADHLEVLPDYRCADWRSSLDQTEAMVRPPACTFHVGGARTCACLLLFHFATAAPAELGVAWLTLRSPLTDPRQLGDSPTTRVEPAGNRLYQLIAGDREAIHAAAAGQRIPRMCQRRDGDPPRARSVNGAHSNYFALDQTRLTYVKRDGLICKTINASRRTHEIKARCRIPRQSMPF
jgi:hypothetical protein